MRLTKSGVRQGIRKLHWLVSTQFGFDPRRTCSSMKGLPRYLRDLFRFRAAYTGRLELMPCLHDWHEEGGSTKSEYFWQDLLVARMIFAARPEKHVDIGSRVDGFVAHVASFRELEIFDIRPITSRIPGVTFKQADLMNLDAPMPDYCDSLSCLHALEHFGLGRYGDPIDPEGFATGLANMASLLREGGVFYLSVPVGRARVEFNAHRVSDPRVVVSLATRSSLSLSGLTLIHPDGNVEKVPPGETNLTNIASQRYALGLFEFHKHSGPK